MVATMFFEDSTRTRLSFEIAARRLGVEALDIGPSSSTSKGETLVDSAKTIEAMGVDALIVRAGPSGAAHLIARHVSVPVINAGDGKHEHPTQGLLDCLTLCRALGRDDFDLSGVRVAIVGDVVSSRVARSAVAGFGALGAEVVCVGPVHLAPRSLEGLGCSVSHDLDGVIGDVDAVMMLRVQRERHGGTEVRRHEGGEWGAAGSVGAYRAGFALTAERAGRMKAGAVVMHPGPMNRGVEIDSEVADGARSLVTRQVAAGVVVRMAVIERALGGASG